MRALQRGQTRLAVLHHVDADPAAGRRRTGRRRTDRPHVQRPVAHRGEPAVRGPVFEVDQGDASAILAQEGERQRTPITLHAASR